MLEKKMKTAGFVLAAGLMFIGSSVQASVVKWTFQTGRDIYAAPAYHQNTIYIGSLDSVFYAIDAQTGQEQWRFKTEQPVHSTAAIAEGMVCFESGNQLYGLDLSGQLQWRVPLYTESLINQIDSWDFYHSSPVIHQGIAYVGTEQGWIFGVRVANGDIVFQTQTSEKAAIRIAPGIYENKLFAGDWEGMLHVYNLDDGILLWQYDTRNDNQYGWTNAIQTELTFADSAVYFAGRSCNAYSLNINTGSRNWIYTEPNLWIVGGGTLAGDLICFGSSNQKKLYALNRYTGEEQWIGSPDHRLWGVPYYNGTCLIAGAGSLLAFDGETGDIVNRLYFDADNVHPDTMQITWMGSVSSQPSTALANIHSSPVCHEGVIYFGCDDGCLYAVYMDSLIYRPLPESRLIDDSRLDLGDVSNQSDGLQIQIELINSGEGEDCFDISISGAVFPEGALEILPEQITVLPADTQAVVIALNPALLRSKRYRPTVNFLSTCGLQNIKLKKKIMFNVVEGSAAASCPVSGPETFTVLQNYPNPFNPQTTIAYYLPQRSHVQLTIYNALGQIVQSLVDDVQEAGAYQTRWPAAAGASPANGVYFCALSRDAQFVDMKKMVLLQ